MVRGPASWSCGDAGYGFSSCVHPNVPSVSRITDAPGSSPLRWGFICIRQPAGMAPEGVWNCPSTTVICGTAPKTDCGQRMRSVAKASWVRKKSYSIVVLMLVYSRSHSSPLMKRDKKLNLWLLTHKSSITAFWSVFFLHFWCRLQYLVHITFSRFLMTLSVRFRQKCWEDDFVCETFMSAIRVQKNNKSY